MTRNPHFKNLAARIAEAERRAERAREDRDDNGDPDGEQAARSDDQIDET